MSNNDRPNVINDSAYNPTAKSNADLLGATARRRGEEIIQGVAKPAGGGYAAQAAAAAAAGYPAGVLPPHLRNPLAGEGAAPAISVAKPKPKKQWIEVGSYANLVSVRLVELNGFAAMAIESQANKDLSMVTLPLPAGTRIVLKPVEPEVIVDDEVKLIRFPLDSFGGSLLVTFSEKLGVSATWHPGTF